MSQTQSLPRLVPVHVEIPHGPDGNVDKVNRKYKKIRHELKKLRKAILTDDKVLTAEPMFTIMVLFLAEGLFFH